MDNQVWPYEAEFFEDKDASIEIPEGCLKHIFARVGGQEYVIDAYAFPNFREVADMAKRRVGDKRVPVAIENNRVVSFPTLRSPGA